MSDAARAPSALLQEHRDDLMGFLSRHAGWLLRYETPDDLMQGLHVRVLERGGGFDYQSREQFLSWIHTVARSHLADRANYWSALKRKSARLLRLTQGGTPSSDPGAVAEPAASMTGPSTFAARREQLSLAVRVLGALLERDRNLVQWSSQGVSLEEMAKRLGISYAAAQRAHLRALDRYRKAFQMAAGIHPG